MMWFWKQRNDGGMEAVVGNIGIVAYSNGCWGVHQRVEYGATVCWTDSNQQVRGKDLQEAQQRAQAAAMVLHQLREQQKR